MHPRSTQSARQLLARFGLPTLLAAFVALTLTIGSLLALGLSLAQAGHRSYVELWEDTILTLCGNAGNVLPAHGDGAVFRLLGVASAIVGLITPALFLGAIVFKVFVARDVLVSGRALALERGREGWELVVRLYNATKLEVFDVAFDATLYIDVPGEDSSAITTFHWPLEVWGARWPVAPTHVPYSLMVRLGDDGVDSDSDGGTIRLVAIQGHELTESCRLLVRVTARVPALATEYVDAWWFDLATDVCTLPYGRIDTGAETATAGWEHFEAPQEMRAVIGPRADPEPATP